MKHYIEPGFYYITRPAANPAEGHRLCIYRENVMHKQLGKIDLLLSNDPWYELDADKQAKHKLEQLRDGKIVERSTDSVFLGRKRARLHL